MTNSIKSTAYCNFYLINYFVTETNSAINYIFFNSCILYLCCDFKNYIIFHSRNILFFN